MLNPSELGKPHEPRKPHNPSGQVTAHLPGRKTARELSIIAACGCCPAVLAETHLGVGSFLIDRVPYEPAFGAGLLCFVVATWFGALVHLRADNTCSPQSLSWARLPLIVSYAFVAVCALASLILRWETDGRYSDMANGINLIRVAALIACATAICEFVLWALHAPILWVRLVYATMLVVAAPVACLLVLEILS